MTASVDPRRALGGRGEQLAAEHLMRAGYVILARNFRTRFGELDLVAADEHCLVFCEVKTRIAGTRRGPAGPLDAIGPRKRAQVRAMAREWLMHSSAQTRPRRPELRFDAIGILMSRNGSLVSLDHVENAF
ncbi:MAG TPA: YraN family protein [Thermoleophilaceae bacterium]|jgi:putative endonuclease|nr:YraN family protein [Thermoleophilaceae bacterium]